MLHNLHSNRHHCKSFYMLINRSSPAHKYFSIFFFVINSFQAMGSKGLLVNFLLDHFYLIVCLRCNVVIYF